MVLNLQPPNSERPSASFRAKMTELHRRQDELSRRTDPAGEAEYQEVVQQITELTRGGTC